jgi:hypothetical protein
MMKTIKLAITAFAIMTSTLTWAHQPGISSTTLIEGESGQWIIQLNSSLTSFQHEVKNAFGEDSYASADQFNQLVIKHFREHLTIKMNGNKMTLTNGYVKLGHATTVVFELSGDFGNVDDIFVKNEAFKNIHDSRSVFRIIKEEYKKNEIILNNKNNYQVNVSLEDNRFVLENTPLISQHVVIIFGILMALGLAFLFLFKMSDKKLNALEGLKITLRLK